MSNERAVPLADRLDEVHDDAWVRKVAATAVQALADSEPDGPCIEAQDLLQGTDAESYFVVSAAALEDVVYCAISNQLYDDRRLRTHTPAEPDVAALLDALKDLQQLAHMCMTGQVDSVQAIGESIEAVTARLRTHTETPREIMDAEAQINRLAEFIMHEIPGEPSQSEGAVECAIRLLRAAHTETPRTTDGIGTLVRDFATALEDKLRQAEKKYGWNDAWRTDDADGIRRSLLHHVEKGDPRDVAAYCAFLWARGESTATETPRTEQEAGWFAWEDVHMLRRYVTESRNSWDDRSGDTAWLESLADRIASLLSDATETPRTERCKGCGHPPHAPGRCPRTVGREMYQEACHCGETPRTEPEADDA